MNAAGMNAVLNNVSATLTMPFFQALVTDGKISQGELDGTRTNLSASLAAVKQMPKERLEALVAQYDKELTGYNDKFNSAWAQDALGGFRSAQIMAGYVTTIMNKHAISEVPKSEIALQ